MYRGEREDVSIYYRVDEEGKDVCKWWIFLSWQQGAGSDKTSILIRNEDDPLYGFIEGIGPATTLMMIGVSLNGRQRDKMGVFLALFKEAIGSIAPASIYAAAEEATPKAAFYDTIFSNFHYTAINLIGATAILGRYVCMCTPYAWTWLLIWYGGLFSPSLSPGGVSSKGILSPSLNHGEVGLSIFLPLS